MKLRFSSRQVFLIAGGVALLVAALVWGIVAFNEGSPGASVKKQSVVPPALPPPSDKPEPKKSPGKPAITDPLLAGIYADDLAAVKARFLSKVYDDDYGLYLSAFAARLAKEDPEGGLTWLLSLESTGDVQSAIVAFARGLQNGHPGKLDWALKQSMPPSLYQAFVSGAASAMTADLDNAMKFIKKASKSPTESDWLARSMMMTLSQDRSSEGCLKLMKLADAFPNAVPSEQHGAALYYLWTEDPAKALAIMENKNDFQSKPGVFASFTELYARKDLEAASNWVNKLPDGITKDYAISSIAKAASHVSPLNGLRWATSVRDSGLRPQVMNNLVDLSAYHDPEGTKKVIEQAGFSAAESAKWVARINQQAARLR